VEEIRLEAHLDVDLDEILFLAIGRVNAEIHTVPVGVPSGSAMAGLERLLDELHGAFPGEVFERGTLG
jgi:hypothetical protein